MKPTKKNTLSLSDATHTVPGMDPALVHPRGRNSVHFKLKPDGSYTITEYRGKSLYDVMPLSADDAQKTWTSFKARGWTEQ